MQAYTFGLDIKLPEQDYKGSNFCISPPTFLSYGKFYISTTLSGGKFAKQQKYFSYSFENPYFCKR